MNNTNYNYHNFQDLPQNNNTYQYQLGQPINEGYNYNNNYGYQYPQQQVELNQLNNQQNPVVVVNTNPNLINVQYSNPEIIYCSSSIRSSRKHGNDGVGVSGIINALQQIYSELNLVFQLDLVGQFNLLSSYSMETKVFQPLISQNRYISSEAIRNGKIAFCCKSLQSVIIKYFQYLITLLSIIVISLSIGYPIYLKQSDSASQLIIPYAIQVLSFVLQTILLAISLLYTLPKLLQLSLLLSILNFIFSFVIIVISGFVEFNTHGNNNVGTRFAVQVPCMFMLLFSFMLYSAILAGTRRLLVLLKQLEQTEFIDGNCI
ncbi:hypothetical protein ABPG74_002647 [Tetrahymena malaccensis]